MSNNFLLYPQVLVPTYRAGRYGRWSLGFTHGAMPGYFTPQIVSSEGVPALTRREGRHNTVWMSLTQMERESHMPHIAAARGSVCVMGLGMGMYLYNIIQKPEVEQVVVIEKDPSVIALLSQITDLSTWPGWNKVEIVCADALTWKSVEPFDFLYADFWKRMADSNMAQYMRKVRVNVPHAALYGYWTQECDYVDFIRENGIQPRNSRPIHYLRWAESMNMPLVGVGDPNYHWLAVLAVSVQLMARLIRDDDAVSAAIVRGFIDEIILKLDRRMAIMAESSCL